MAKGRLPLIPRGRPLPADHYAEVTDAANAVREVTGDNRYISAARANGAIHVKWIGPPIRNSAPVKMLVTAIANNSLTCKRVDASDAAVGDDITVNRPEHLRHGTASRWPLITTWTTVNAQEATVGNGTLSGTAKVTPAYVANVSLIYAAYNAATGAWEDTNRDGRAWAIEE